MRLGIFSVAMVGGLLTVGTCGAQTPAQESAQLLERIGVPPTAAVSTAPVPGIPAGKTLKVYLAFGMDMRVRDNFVGWVEKWNDKDAKKYGALVLVDKIADADLVFARFALRDQKDRHLAADTRSVPTVDTTTTTANVEGGGVHATGSSRTTAYGSAVVSEQYTYDTVPVFAYILRTTEAGPQILWRYAITVPIGYVETKDSGRKLFDDFKKLAKERPRLP
jgi:hypothetical protein